MAESVLDRVAPLHSPTSSAPLVQANTTSIAATDWSEPQRFEFTGSGAEYFRIWVVNILLSLLTLGIYSAWAKVRRLQYFHRNTVVGGAIFDYHGEPKAILKGRALALFLLVAYQVSTGISVPVAAAVIVLLLAITPWLLAMAFRFKMFNTSYRGLRFHFRGTVGQAYRMLLLFPLVLAAIGVFAWSMIATYSRDPGIGVLVFAGLLPLLAVAGTVPLAHYLLKRYQFANTDYGQTPFFFHARATDFFKIYGKSLGMVLLGVIPAGIFTLLTAGAAAALQETAFGEVFALLYALLSVYVFYLFVRPYFESRAQNLVWNHTEIGMHRFESNVRARKLLWIHASNLFMIAITLGLFKPFAAVRLAKYRVESMVLIPGADLEHFFADQSADDPSAAGQEAGDLFDIDIAL